VKQTVQRALLVLLMSSWLLASTGRAIPLLAVSSLSFENLTITSASGSISFAGPWTADAFAAAEGVSTFDISFDGITSASASSAFGFAQASSGAAPMTLSGAADSEISIPDGAAPSFSFATGRSSLSNSFTVSGGAGSVGVTFSVDLVGQLAVATSELGVMAKAETVFALELDGNPVLFRADSFSIGSEASQSATFATTLVSSQTLEFDTPYFLFVQSDSESSGVSTVPDSPTALTNLTLIGVLVLETFLRRRRPSPANGR
jgi:hypothetical protein